MNDGPIANDVEYEALLRRIAALMDAAPGTPEGDELVRLAALATAYERLRLMPRAQKLPS